jgi:hypothetical protein
MSRLFGDVVQNGYVVRDIAAAMRHWIEVLDVGPWFYIEHLPVPDFQYKGQPSAVDISLALANSGALQIELIQQRNAAPSLYLDFLNAGHEGLQHLGYGTRQFDTDLARLLEMGYAVGHAGSVSGRGRFVYLLTEGHPGTIVELFDMSQGRDRVFAGIAAAARNWDGREPIRNTLPTA